MDKRSGRQSNIHGQRSGRLRIASGRHLPSDCSGCLAWGARPAAWSQTFAWLLRVPARRRHCAAVPWATLFVAPWSRVVGIDQATTGPGRPSSHCRQLAVACRQLGSSLRGPQAAVLPRPATPLLQVLSSTMVGRPTAS